MLHQPRNQGSETCRHDGGADPEYPTATHDASLSGLFHVPPAEENPLQFACQNFEIWTIGVTRRSEPVLRSVGGLWRTGPWPIESFSTSTATRSTRRGRNTMPTGPRRVRRVLSTEDFFTKTCALADAFVELGVTAGDRVLLLSDNRPEWHMVDLAVLDLGAVDVPVYQTLTPAQLAYQVNDSGAAVAVAENPIQMAKLLEILARVPGPSPPHPDRRGSAPTASSSSMHSRPPKTAPPTGASGIVPAPSTNRSWQRSFTPQAPQASRRVSC